MSAGPIPDLSDVPRGGVPAPRATPLWRKAIPYLGTVAIFALIFWRIPIRKVEQALSQVPVLEFLAVFMPYSLFYCAIDSSCLTWVVRRFNARMRYRDIVTGQMVWLGGMGWDWGGK